MPRPKVFDSRVSPERVVSLYMQDKRSTREIAGLVGAESCVIPGVVPLASLRGPGRWLVSSWLGSRGVSLRPPKEGADLAKALRPDLAAAACVWPGCRQAAGGQSPFEALCPGHAGAAESREPGWNCVFGQCTGSAVWNELWCSWHAAKVRGST